MSLADSYRATKERGNGFVLVVSRAEEAAASFCQPSWRLGALSILMDAERVYLGCQLPDASPSRRS